MLSYLAGLSAGRTALWCYLVWYAITVVNHFDPSISIWANSMGISAVIGVALLLSVSGKRAPGDHWQTFRLFLMPFCVSSFSALIKGKGFWLIFPPSIDELLMSVGACVVFVLLVAVTKKFHFPTAA
jgi:predicted neutral ceramidase superfamily lipid hydrolase